MSRVVNHIAEHMFKVSGMVKWLLHYHSQKNHGCTCHPYGSKGHPAVCHENNNDQCSCCKQYNKTSNFQMSRTYWVCSGAFLCHPLLSRILLWSCLRGREINFTQFFSHFLLKFLTLFISVQIYPLFEILAHFQKLFSTDGREIIIY